MEILFNELSLVGQFPDQDSFVTTGLTSFLRILKEIWGYSSILLLKKSDVWNKQITATHTLYDFTKRNDAFRKSDEVRSLKIQIDSLTKEPFWDDTSKQHADTIHKLNDIIVNGSSPAEACERDQIIASFIDSNTSSDPLIIDRNGTCIPLLNLIQKGRLTEHLWKNKQLTFEQYVMSRFSEGKLNFSQINSNFGFSTIQPSEESLFIEAFNKFEYLQWEQILKDNGFNYKQFHGKPISKVVQGQNTYKFRINEKMRCHGYREGDTFFVIGFERDHSLSDHG